MAEPVIRLDVFLNNPSNIAQIQKFIKNSLNNTPIDVKINVTGAGGAKTTLSNINNINKAMSGLNKNAAVSSAAFSKVFREVDNFGRALARSDSGLSNIQRQFKGVSKSAKETGGILKDFSDQIGLASKRYAAFAISSTAFIGIFARIGEGITEAIKYQKELIRFQQVGGDTSTTIKGISREIRQLSKEFGASSIELAKTSVTLRQAGYSADEVKSSLDALAKSALAPNFDSLEQTVEGLIALNSQFQKSLKDSEKSLSQINAVAGAFAVEASDLVIGVQKLGGAFSAAGGSFEELLGVMTAVRSTTRESADTIATGLRTILARTQRSTTIADLEKLGISLRANASEAKQFGIQVGGILPIFARLQKLSQATSGLSPSDPRFSQILEIVGGVRQISKTTPILLSFNKAVDATNLALRSTNTLAKDATLAQKSLDVQLKELKESFLDLFETIGGNKFLKTMLDGFIKLSKEANELGHNLEPLIPIFAAFAARGAFGIGKNLFGTISRGIPLSVKTQTGFGGSGLFIKRNRGGIVPGPNVNADIVKDSVDPGTYILNRTASRKVLGFQRGGQVPVKLTPGEIKIPPEVVKKVGLGDLQLLNQTSGKSLTPELQNRLLRYLNNIPSATGESKIAYKQNFLLAGGNPALLKGLNRGGLVRQGFIEGGQLPDDILALLLSQRQEAYQEVKKGNTTKYADPRAKKAYDQTIEQIEKQYPGTKARLERIYGKNIGQGEGRVVNPEYDSPSSRNIRQAASEFNLVGLGRGKLRATQLQDTDIARTTSIGENRSDLVNRPSGNRSLRDYNRERLARLEAISGQYDRNNPVRRSIIAQRLTPQLIQAAENVIRQPNPYEFIRILKQVSGKKSGDIINDIVEKGLFYGTFEKRVYTGGTTKTGRKQYVKDPKGTRTPENVPSSIAGLLQGVRTLSPEQRLELLGQYVKLPPNIAAPSSAIPFDKNTARDYNATLQQLNFIKEKTGLSEIEILKSLEGGKALQGKIKKTSLRDFRTFTASEKRTLDTFNAAKVFGLNQEEFPFFAQASTSAISQATKTPYVPPTNPRFTSSRVPGEANPSQTFNNLPGAPVAGSLNALPIPRYVRPGTTPVVAGGLGRSFPFVAGGAQPPRNPPIIASAASPGDDPLKQLNNNLKKLIVQTDFALKEQRSATYRGGVPIIGGGRVQGPQQPNVPLLRSGIPLVDSGIILGSNGLPISLGNASPNNSRGRISIRPSKGKTIGDLLSVSPTLKQAGIEDADDFRNFAKSIGLPISIPQKGSIKDRALVRQSLDNDYIRYIANEVLIEARKQNESRRTQSLVNNRRQIELNQINQFTSRARARRFNLITSGQRGIADDTQFIDPKLAPQFNPDVLKNVVPSGVRFSSPIGKSGEFDVSRGIFQDANIKKTTQEITEKVAQITVRDALFATNESLDSFLKSSGLDPKKDAARIDSVLNQVIPFRYQEVSNQTTTVTPAIPLGSPIASQNPERRDRFSDRVRRRAQQRFLDTAASFKRGGLGGAILGLDEFGGTPGSLDPIFNDILNKKGKVVGKGNRIVGVTGGKKFNYGFNVDVLGIPNAGVTSGIRRGINNRLGTPVQDDPQIRINRAGSGRLLIDELITKFGSDLGILKTLKKARSKLAINPKTGERDLKEASQIITDLAKSNQQVLDTIIQRKQNFIKRFVIGQENQINLALNDAIIDSGAKVPKTAQPLDFANPLGGSNRNQTLGNTRGFRGSTRAAGDILVDQYGNPVYGGKGAQSPLGVGRGFGAQLVDRAFQRDIQLGLRRVGLGNFQNLSGILAQQVTNANIDNITTSYDGRARKNFSDTTTNLVNEQFGVFRSGRQSILNRLGGGIGQQSLARARSSGVSTREVPTGRFIVEGLDHTGNDVQVPIAASSAAEAKQLARQQGVLATANPRQETRTERIRDPRLRRPVARQLQGLSRRAAPQAISTILTKGESVLSDLVSRNNTVRFQSLDEGQQLEYLAKRAKRLGLVRNVSDLDINDLRALSGAGQEVNNLNNRKGFFRKATGAIRDFSNTGTGRFIGGLGNKAALGSTGLLLAAQAVGPQRLARSERGGARLSGLLSGVATGAIAGGALGPYGAAIGGVIGGFVGVTQSLKDFDNQLKEVEFDKTFANLSRDLTNIANRNNPLTGRDIKSVTSFISATEAEARRRFQSPEERKDFLAQSFGANAQQIQSIIGLIGRTPGAFDRKATPEENLQRFFDFGNGQGASIARAFALGNNLTQPEANKAIQEQIKNALLAEQSSQALQNLTRETDRVANLFENLANAVNVSTIRYREASEQLGAFSLALDNNRIVPPSISSGVGAFGVLGGQDLFNRSAQFISNLLPNRVIGADANFGGIPLPRTNRQALFSELTSANQAAIALPDILRKVAADPQANELAPQRIAELLGSTGGISDNIIGRIRDALDALGQEELQKQLENPQLFTKNLIEAISPDFNKLAELAKQLEESTQGFISALQDGRQIELRQRALQDQRSELQSELRRQGVSFVGLPDVANPITRRRPGLTRLGIPSTIPQFAGGTEFGPSPFERRLARQSRIPLFPTTFTGGDPSLALSIEQLNQPFLQSQSRLLGSNAVIPGATNPFDINSRLQVTLGQIESGKLDLARATNSEDQNAAIERLANLQNTAEDLNQALSNLADITQVNAAAQEKLVAIEQERAGRLNFAERFIQANPFERAQIAGTLNQARIATQVGLDRFNPQTQSNILNILRQVGDVQTGLGATGNQLADQLIQRSSVGNFANNLLGGPTFAQLEQGRQGAQGEILRGTQTAIQATELLAQNTARERTQFFQTLTQNQATFLQNLGKTVGLSDQENIKQQISNIQIANKDINRATLLGTELQKQGIRPDDINKVISGRKEDFANARLAAQQFDTTLQNRRNLLSDITERDFGSSQRPAGESFNKSRLSPRDEQQVRDLITRSNLNIDEEKALKDINRRVINRSFIAGSDVPGLEVERIVKDVLTRFSGFDVGNALASREAAVSQLRDSTGVDRTVIERLISANDQQLTNITNLSDAINKAGGTFQGVVEQFNQGNQRIQDLREQLNQASQLQAANADSLKKHGEQMAEFAAVIKDAKIQVQSQNKFEVVLNGVELLNRLTENVKAEVVRQAVDVIKAELLKDKVDGV